MSFRHFRSLLPHTSQPHRRPASSLSTSTSFSSHHRKPDVPTRGRLRPLRGVSVGTRLSAARLSRHNTDDKGRDGSGGRETQGRRKSSIHRSPDLSTTQHPEDALYSFRPVRLYPGQLALHRALNPPHMPLPVHLGTVHYQSSNAPASSFEPFTQPPEKSTSARPFVADSQSSGFREHLSIIDALSPDATPFPWQPSEATARSSGIDFPADLARTLAEAGVRNRVTSECDWARVLAHLGDKPFTPGRSSSTQDDGGIRAAVASLETVLSRLKTSAGGGNRLIVVVGPDGDEEWVRMDSTQRKRRKKITKHKYKKRRKVRG